MRHEVRESARVLSQDVFWKPFKAFLAPASKTWSLGAVKPRHDRRWLPVGRAGISHLAAIIFSLARGTLGATGASHVQIARAKIQAANHLTISRSSGETGIYSIRPAR